MPDGAQVNFPDDMPPEQIKGMIASKFPDAVKGVSANNAPTQRPQSNGILQDLSNIGNNFADEQRQRGANLANIVNATSTAPQGNNQQTPGESIIQGGMNEVGAAGDVLGAGINAAAHGLYRTLSPEDQQSMSNTGQNIANNALGQKVGELVNQYNQNQEAYNSANPRAGRNFQAMREGVNLLPMVSPEVRAATEAGNEAAGQALKNVSTDVAKAAIAKTAEALKPDTMYTSDVVKQMATQAYKTADETGGVLSSDFANKLYDTVDAMKPQTEHGIATVGENALAKLTNDWKTLRDKPISLQAAQEMDEGLSQRIDGHVDRVTGKLDKEGKQLYEVQSQFRDMIDNATPQEIVGGKEGFDALKEGRNYWSTALRIGDMERILQRASNTDNAATAIKNGFKTLSNNPSRMIGYSTEEKAAIKKAAQSGIISGTLRTVLGSRLIGTTLGTAVGGLSGGAFGAAAGAAGGAAQSAAARAAAAALQRGRANRVIKTISKRVK